MRLSLPNRDRNLTQLLPQNAIDRDALKRMQSHQSQFCGNMCERLRSPLDRESAFFGFHDITVADLSQRCPGIDMGDSEVATLYSSIDYTDLYFQQIDQQCESSHAV